MIYWVSRFICFLILKAFFRLKVYGRENIPKSGGFLIASNHVSYLDPPAVGVSCPRSLNYMAKKEMFGNFFASWYLSKLHVFPVKRGSADFGSLKNAIRVLNNGSGLLIFPEGTRQTQGVSNDPEPGIGFIAAKIDAAVIPAYVSGTDVVLPKGAKGFKFARVCVYFGKPVFIQKGMPYRDIANRIMEDIRQLSKIEAKEVAVL